MKMKKGERLTIHFIRDFGGLPLFFMLYIICSVFPSAVLSFYYPELITTKLVSVMLVLSSNMSIALFIFMIIFIEWWDISEKIRKKQPKKNLIDKFLEEKNE
ncbi:MAG: hypothetical protein ACFFDN_02675 [Candidatus Hodarchaeota archaeon]